jgi:myosin-1
MPTGGKISNFLLEKSRVVGLGQGERNFHVFYQITRAAGKAEQEALGMMDPKYFNYLNQSSEYTADGIDDLSEYKEMRGAMTVCDISPGDQHLIMEIVAGILHVCIKLTHLAWKH